MEHMLTSSLRRRLASPPTSVDKVTTTGEGQASTGGQGRKETTTSKAREALFQQIQVSLEFKIFLIDFGTQKVFKTTSTEPVSKGLHMRLSDWDFVIMIIQAKLLWNQRLDGQMMLLKTHSLTSKQIYLYIL